MYKKILMSIFIALLLTACNRGIAVTDEVLAPFTLIIENHSSQAVTGRVYFYSAGPDELGYSRDDLLDGLQIDLIAYGSTTFQMRGYKISPRINPANYSLFYDLREINVNNYSWMNSKDLYDYGDPPHHQWQQASSDRPFILQLDSDGISGRIIFN